MKTIVLSMLLLCSACSPLQQAPLVYASKISVGVDISGTSTESPGVSMSVGYKQVDAAYVPVAVAKKCEESTQSNCANPIYELKFAVGSSELEGNRRSGPGEEEAKAILKEFEELSKQSALNEGIVAASAGEIAAISKRRSELEAKKQAAIVASARVQEINGELGKLDQTAADYEQRRLALTTQRDKILPAPLVASEDAELAAVPAKIAAAQGRLDGASANMAALQQSLGKLKEKALAAQAILGKVNSKDAYSVFGRFEGTNNVKGDGAAVVLGKVFSTGVASQNLTRGMATYYANLGATACYESVAKVASGLDSAKLQLFLAECKSVVAKNDTNQ